MQAFRDTVNLVQQLYIRWLLVVTYIIKLKCESNIVDYGHDVIYWRLVRVPDQTKTNYSTNTDRCYH